MPNVAVLDNWMPQRFMATTAKAARPEFMASFGDTYFLLVDVGADVSGGVLAGLTVTSPLGSVLPPPPNGEGVGEQTTQLHELDTAPPGVLEAVDLDAMAGQRRFVVPVSKRVSNAFVTKVAIGRTNNNDIVLKHPSVSKFHAFITYSNGQVRLHDADSKNRTRVNGKVIDSVTSLQPGDQVQFGLVEALLCGANSLWRTVHAS